VNNRESYYFYYASIYNTPTISSDTKSDACIDVKTPRYCLPALVLSIITYEY